MGDVRSEPKDFYPYQTLEVEYETEPLPIEMLEAHPYVLHRTPVFALEDMLATLDTESPFPYSDIAFMLVTSNEQLGLRAILENDELFLTVEADPGDSSMIGLYEELMQIQERLIVSLGINVPILASTIEEVSQMDQIAYYKKLLVSGYLFDYTEKIHKLFDLIEFRFPPEDVLELADRKMRVAITKYDKIFYRPVIVSERKRTFYFLGREIEGYESAIERNRFRIAPEEDHWILEVTPEEKEKLLLKAGKNDHS